MNREIIRWLCAFVALTGLWEAISVALRIFDPLPPDMPAGAFLGLGPMWFYLAFLVAALATVVFGLSLAIRICMLAIASRRRAFRKHSS